MIGTTAHERHMKLVEDSDRPLDEIKEQKDNSFVCRVCGGTSYEAITNINGFTSFGSSVYADYYKCNNCSVLFKDVNLFSVAKSNEKGIGYFGQRHDFGEGSTDYPYE